MRPLDRQFACPLRCLLLIMLCTLLSACADTRRQPPDRVLQQVHPSGAHRIAFDAGGARLASGGLHGEIHVWRVSDGARLATLDKHQDAVRGLAWLDDEQLVSVDSEGLVVIWQVAGGQPLVTQQLDAAQAMVLAGDGRGLLVAVHDRLLRLRLPSLEIVRQEPLGGRITALAAHDGRYAVALEDRRVLLLDADLSPVRELQRPSRQVTSLRFAPDGAVLLAGSWFRLLVWDLRSDTLEERATEHLGKLASVDISPDGRWWLSLGRETDSAVRLLDARTGQVLRRYRSHALCGREIRFSPDGVHAASAAEDGSVHLYDFRTPYRPVTLYPQTD